MKTGELAYFKTHYYGGIRKYQWVTIPWSSTASRALRDGTAVSVNIGADEGDPRLVITDLLPHLGAEQNKKTLAEAIPAETLNLLLGSRPIGDAEESGRVKLAVMKLLNEKYGITEDDFTSAELEAVPAVKATDIGLDRSMIGAYGHDDRVCAYAALRALLDLEETPEKTAVCVLADKEEIGSDGVTGMQSAAFDTFMEDLCESQSVPVRVCFEKSFCLSADVTAAYDPNFSDVYEKRNAAYLNHGIGLCKYTGARGKSGASDADAETVAYVRRLFDGAGVIWQIAELGKVDAGGGGTVAMYMANRNITTLDAGVCRCSPCTLPLRPYPSWTVMRPTAAWRPSTGRTADRPADRPSANGRPSIEGGLPFFRRFATAGGQRPGIFPVSPQKFFRPFGCITGRNMVR